MKQYILNEMQGAFYSHEDKITVYREYGLSPNGNNINGRWVYRQNGEFIDMDTYQIDLMGRNGLKSNEH